VNHQDQGVSIMRLLFNGLLLVAAFGLQSGFAVAGPVNINTADEETLAAELEGVGPALAAAIVRDREENGTYESPDAITRVRGIGQKVLDDNREFIMVADKEPESQ
jgi:competence protein ComEA